MDHDKILNDLFNHDKLARQTERKLLASGDRKGLSKTLCRVARAQLKSRKPEAADQLLLLTGLLPQVGTFEAATVLFELLRDESLEHHDRHFAATEALAELGEEHFELLDRAAQRVLKDGVNGLTLEALAYVLAEVDRPEKVDLMLAMLSHAEPQVVVASLEVAGEQGWDDRVWKQLLKLSKDTRDIIVEDEHEGRVTMTIAELASEVVETLRTLGRRDDV